MNLKTLTNSTSLLFATAAVAMIAAAVSNLRAYSVQDYGPPSTPPPSTPPPETDHLPPAFQPIDVTHTPASMNGILQQPGLGGLGVQQSARFPSTDRLSGSLDFLLVQPQSATDVFTKVSAYVANLQNGTLLASVKKPSETGVVATPVGDVAFSSNSDAFVSYDAASDVLRVRNVDGLSQRVKVKISKGPLAGKIFAVEPGFELTVSSHELSGAQIRPQDGILRRGSHLIDGKYAAVAQYFVQGALQQSALVSELELKQANDAKSRRIVSDMSRMAAVLNQVNGTQGFGH